MIGVLVILSIVNCNILFCFDLCGKIRCAIDGSEFAGKGRKSVSANATKANYLLLLLSKTNANTLLQLITVFELR